MTARRLAEEHQARLRGPVPIRGARWSSAPRADRARPRRSVLHPVGVLLVRIGHRLAGPDVAVEPKVVSLHRAAGRT